MAKQRDVDLEGQSIEDADLRTTAANHELPSTAIDKVFHSKGVAAVERPAKEGAAEHVDGPACGQHGSPEYYEHLVTLALTDRHLGNHALSFEFLHQIVLLDHQKKLAEHLRDVVHDSTTSSAKISEISDRLHAYSKATVDYIFWKKKEKMFQDIEIPSVPFQDLNSRNESNRAFKDLSNAYRVLIPELEEVQSLRAGIPNSSPYCWLDSDADRGQQPTESNQQRQSDTARVLNHFAIAIVGGISLIVPMLIMALHRSRVTSLVTTSVAVTLFAIVLALWPVISRRFFPWRGGRAYIVDDDEGLGSKDVLLVTAAYAAVLVVFVGASLSNVE